MDFALTRYYCREKYFHTMQRIAESASLNSPDSGLKLQYCIALILQSKIGEALRELESLLVKPDIGLAVILASIHAQNLCEVSSTCVRIEILRVRYYTACFSNHRYLTVKR